MQDGSVYNGSVHTNALGVTVGAALALIGLVLFWVVPTRVTHPAAARVIGGAAFVIGGWMAVST